MICSSCQPLSDPLFQISSPTVTVCEKLRNPKKNLHVGFSVKPTGTGACVSLSSSSPSFRVIERSIPLVASVAILLWSNPAKAGFLSGYSGIESIPGPQLPQVEFLSRFNGLIFTYFILVIVYMLYFKFTIWNKKIASNSPFAEENQKKYAEADA